MKGPKAVHSLGWRYATVVMACCLVCGSWAVYADRRSSTPVGRIDGYVWHDWNENGQREAGEPPISHVVIVLADLSGEKVDQTHTDTSGSYAFEVVSRGQYLLSENDPQGYTSSTPNLVSIDLETASSVRHDFGDVLSVPGCFRLVSGSVYEDKDRDAARNETEPAYEGAVVRIIGLDYSMAGLAQSDEYGTYAARGLLPARYYVAMNPPQLNLVGTSPLYWGVDLRGCHPAQIDFGFADGRGSATESGWTDSPEADSDPRLRRVSRVSGMVGFIMTDGLAGFTSVHPRAGVKVTLLEGKGKVVAEQLTDAEGRYAFEGLRWKHYYLIQEPLEGYEPLLAWSWGLAPTDGSDIVINLHNRLVAGVPPKPVYLPLVSSASPL